MFAFLPLDDLLPLGLESSQACESVLVPLPRRFRLRCGVQSAGRHPNSSCCPGRGLCFLVGAGACWTLRCIMAFDLAIRLARAFARRAQSQWFWRHLGQVVMGVLNHWGEGELSFNDSCHTG